jgi:lipopolysaccharide export system permease protein
VILFRYIFREVFQTFAAVTLVLLVIVVCGRLVKYLASAAAGDLAPQILFSVIFYRLPGFLELILPLAFFVAVLLALGRLYVDSEMTVMSACGLGRGALLRAVLAPAVLVALLVALLSLWLGPAGLTRVQQIFDDADASTGLELLVAGRFRLLDKEDGLVTYVDEIDSDSGEMIGIFAAGSRAADGGDQQVLVMASRARIEPDADSGERYLVLRDGVRYVGRAGELEFQEMTFDRFGQWLEQRAVQARPPKKDAVATTALLGSRDPEHRATLQWRLSLVLLVLISALIAVAMARTDHRRGRYGKLFPAFLLFMIYLLALNAGRDALAKEKLPEVFGLWGVHLLFLAVGLLLLFGADCWRRWQRWWVSRRSGTPRPDGGGAGAAA